MVCLNGEMASFEMMLDCVVADFLWGESVCRTNLPSALVAPSSHRPDSGLEVDKQTGREKVCDRRGTDRFSQ